MKDLKEQQVEALQTMYQYNKKLKDAIRQVSVELKTEKQEDTDAYLEMIFKGINWDIQVISGTLDLINQEKELFDKDAINDIILDVNRLVGASDDLGLAKTLEEKLLPMLDQWDGEVMRVTGIQEN